MINYCDRPPPDAVRPYLPLKRVAARTTIRGAITCDQPIGMWTHFMSRRTLPCLHADCPGCNSDLPKRYEAYLTLITATTKEHAIWALTPGAADALYSHAPDPDHMRGLIIQIVRIGARTNGRLTVKVEDTDIGAFKLPEPPNVIDHLLNIWGFDQSQFAQDHPGVANRVAQHFKKNGATNGT